MRREDSQINDWNDNIVVVTFDERYAADFAQLSREWLESYFPLDDVDWAIWDRFPEAIMAGGGEIFFALLESEVIGTCAVMRMGRGSFELGGLTVTEHMQGRGIRRRLLRAGIVWAHTEVAQTIGVVVKAAEVNVAVGLYEQFGFVRRPSEGKPWFTEGDVNMELIL